MGLGVGNAEWLERHPQSAQHVPDSVPGPSFPASGLCGRVWGSQGISNLIEHIQPLLCMSVHICAIGPWVSYGTFQPQFPPL